MKKLLIISVFIFLTGLFAGIFFSYGLSDENKTYLIDLLMSGLTASDKGFFASLSVSLITNLTVVALMLTAICTKFLCPIPMLLLLYKSFTLGFSNSLLYIGQAIGNELDQATGLTESAAFISLLHIVPQNIFFIPAFITLAAVTFKYSLNSHSKIKRSSRKKKDLHKLILICIVTVAAGCIIEAIVL